MRDAVRFPEQPPPLCRFPNWRRPGNTVREPALPLQGFMPDEHSSLGGLLLANPEIATGLYYFVFIT
jgi:hypothetical protein